MKSIIVALLASGLVSAALSADKIPYKPKENRKIKAMGGSVVVPNSMKGHILVANMQTTIPADEIEKTAKHLAAMTRLDVRFQTITGDIDVFKASEKSKELGANATIFITDSDKCDITLLCAPENGWTIINSAAVTKGAKNPTFAAARVRKELIRGFFAATGAMNSRYPGTVMNYVGKPSDLDNLVEEVPVDMSMRTIEYLSKMGVTPIQYTTYYRAVQQGWAAAPTNDIQKAVWDKVHAMPTAPIKIKPETKKVTE